MNECKYIVREDPNDCRRVQIVMSASESKGKDLMKLPKTCTVGTDGYTVLASFNRYTVQVCFDSACAEKSFYVLIQDPLPNICSDIPNVYEVRDPNAFGTFMDFEIPKNMTLENFATMFRQVICCVNCSNEITGPTGDMFLC